MFEQTGRDPVGGEEPRRPAAAGVSDIESWTASLVRVDRDVSDEVRIDQLRALEELSCAVAAAQARISVDFDASMRSQQEAHGAERDEVGRGVAAQIALARRISPARATRQLSVDKAVVTDMPHALAAMERGKLSGWRATLLARETSGLSAADRQRIDAELCADLERLESWGDRRLAAEARRLAANLDPRAVVERARWAESERTVTIRPAPDTMCYLTALLPVAQGVGAYAALVAAADSARATGDPRSRGQVMADTLVGRIRQGDVLHPGVPAVTVGLGDDRPDVLRSRRRHGRRRGLRPIPGELARELLDRATDVHEVTWLRRLYTSPTTGELVNLDDQPVEFRKSMIRLIRLRDRRCRTPWCDAPIRHTDHPVPRRAGGRATRENGQGLCEACNYHKEAPGWSVRPRSGRRGHLIEITTPTGHHYTSRPPPLTPPRWTECEPGVWIVAAA
ncbi:MAG: DUF222 domain-containing protein [Nocardioides sp.]|nr:DUF222 domain-containing protein [Nocardioides sp.]